MQKSSTSVEIVLSIQIQQCINFDMNGTQQRHVLYICWTSKTQTIVFKDSLINWLKAEGRLMIFLELIFIKSLKKELKVCVLVAMGSPGTTAKVTGRFFPFLTFLLERIDSRKKKVQMGRLIKNIKCHHSSYIGRDLTWSLFPAVMC